tara:strand:- start:1868 stop:2083 length:216 start_codon:yes stop_codon:yes gene_type:complete
VSLQRIAVPAHRLDRIDWRRKPLRQGCHQRRIVPPAAADQPARYGRRELISRKRHRRRRKGKQCRCAIGWR